MSASYAGTHEHREIKMATKSQRFDGDRALILEWIAGAAKQSKTWPGLPVSHIPLVMAPVLGEMIVDGTVHIIKVTKPRKDPLGSAAGKTITYTYVQVS
jgi:hypothetical protein